ncbi:MAG: tetratricopeptide repeat protein [Kofleriaceae bacterium]
MVTPARDREALEQAIVRGSELLKQGKLEQAQRAFRSALEIDGENLKVLALLGLSHFRASEFVEARPIYEDLVELAPTDASHRLNLGLVYLKLNDADHAITSLEASRALDPSQGRAVSYLGLAYARAGRYAEAYRSFLIAGQNELASEIEVNLTTAERDGIHSQLGRTPTGPWPTVARTPTPPPPEPSRTMSEPRTKPPTAPPGAKARTVTSRGDLSLKAAAAVELVARLEVPRDANPADAESSPEISIERTSDVEIVAETIQQVNPGTPMTESQQFVLPRVSQPDSAAPLPFEGHSMVSMAVAIAAPVPATAPRTTSGGLAARPLSELATEELVRPDDGTDVFEINANGALLVRVTDRMLTRLDGVHITGGDLAYEIAMRRSRGHQVDERFDDGGTSLHVVTGKGYLIAIPRPDTTFVTVSLDDDILYLREDLVFAFEASLRWENGNVPGLRGKLHIVQFRGDGALALSLTRPLVRVKLPPQGLVFVDAARIAGWIGRVIPRAVVPPSGGPMGSTCVECTGEGIVLVEPAPAAPHPVRVSAPPPPLEPPPLAPPEPPPPEPPEIAQEVADFAADLAAHSERDEI